MRLSYFTNLLVTLFVAGTMLLQFFIILGGTKDVSILRKFYYLRSRTEPISGAAPITQWSLWGPCTSDGSSLDDVGQSTGCAKAKAAYGFQPGEQYGDQEVPQWFPDNRNKTYYMTRLLFPFYLIALVFETPVLFLTIFSIIRRRIAFVMALLTFIAFCFHTTAGAMLTYVAVQSRDHFDDAGIDSEVGKMVIGFTWACTFMLFVNFFLYCCIRPHHAAHKTDGDTAFAPPVRHDEISPNEATDTSGGRFFGFRQNTKGRSTGADDSSFVRAH